ncbi:DNA repair protein RecO [Frigoriflavimonas asaccharolytica]|uniref:DNA repair protein RecO (Recombination protein O) n=1 Tax=Frigoriflavimonas asaccharolytica TaxID=2735899 RepID=A0A8J8GAF5_9FLAO|nr:DNA repair protein RecO [Frigoriflavimonas asaccharolytica]NRS92350.1 DNA repair protein RecO (recombination protein O) [Frigoriflavimonas asaccharolytica]
MHNLQGFLLSYVKFGENDAVLHFFTKENGFQTFFLKGIYSSKNKKKAYLLPLNELQLTINNNFKSGSLSHISRLELIVNRDLNTKVQANAILFFVADFLNQILKLENKNVYIYKALENFLEELRANNYQSHLIFLYSLLEILGFDPLLSSEEFLNPESGNFENDISHPIFNREISALYKILAVSEDIFTVKIPSKLKKLFLDSLLIYFKCHLTDFREPKSLEILKQIFE